MGIEWFANLIQSPEFQGIAATMTAIGFTDSVISKLRQYKNTKHKKSLEWQLIDCMEKALAETQEELGWESDSNAIQETFFGSLFTYNDVFSKESLSDIFKNAVGHPVEDNGIKTWITFFIKQLAQKEHEELYKYFDIHNLLDNLGKSQSYSAGYIITPRTSQWVKDDIICRDDFIHSLSSELSGEFLHLQLTGMGGIGKTEILNKLYAYFAAKLVGNFDHIGLLFYSGSIETDLEQWLDYPKQYKGMQGTKAAQRFLQDLCNEKRVLLLVDDIREKQAVSANNETILRLFNSLRASIVIASRIAIPQFLTRPVSVLSTDACISIFKKQFGKSVATEEESVLANIIEKKAGSNTLIVNRLGIMTKDYGWSVPELSTQLTERKFNIHKGIYDDELLQQEINKLYIVGDDFSAAEKNILEAFSAFPAIPLPQDTCIEWLCEDAAVEPDRCGLLLSRLAEQTWLEKRCNLKDGKPLFSMHQMVTAAVQAQLKMELSNHASLIEKCAASLSRHTLKYEFNRASLLVPFATSIIECFYIEAPPIAILAVSIGIYYTYTANYCEALEWYRKALDIREKFLGAEHPDTATTYNKIAYVYDSQGDYPKALEWYQKALDIREKVLGTEHPDTATTYSNIAAVYDSQGDYPKALEWHQKALDIREKVLGTEHPDTATTYNNIAYVYYNQGDYPKALEWYQIALRIFERKLGADHPYTKSVHYNMSSLGNV